MKTRMPDTDEVYDALTVDEQEGGNHGQHTQHHVQATAQIGFYCRSTQHHTNAKLSAYGMHLPIEEGESLL